MRSNGSNRRRISALEKSLGMGVRPLVVWIQTQPGQDCYRNGHQTQTRAQIEAMTGQDNLIVSGLEFDGDAD